MRIGIVTQPLEMNYGGILQNWALQQVLKGMGHDPITIDAYERFSTPHDIFNYMRSSSLTHAQSQRGVNAVIVGRLQTEFSFLDLFP